MASNLPVREKLTNKMQSALIEAGKLAKQTQPGSRTNEVEIDCTTCLLHQQRRSILLT